MLETHKYINSEAYLKIWSAWNTPYTYKNKHGEAVSYYRYRQHASIFLEWSLVSCDVLLAHLMGIWVRGKLPARGCIKQTADIVFAFD